MFLLEEHLFSGGPLGVSIWAGPSKNGPIPGPDPGNGCQMVALRLTGVLLQQFLRPFKDGTPTCQEGAGTNYIFKNLPNFLGPEMAGDIIFSIPSIPWDLG